MQFGVPIPNITQPSTRAAIFEIARHADELGFDSVWLADHLVRPIRNGSRLTEHFNTWDRYRWDLFEAFVTAGAVAAVTERVKLAFGVVVLPYRNPVITAKMVATLDQLSQGRVILGVGAGYWTEEYRALGILQRDTGARTDEYIEAFRAMWASDEPTFHGHFVDVDNILFKPRPAQERLPIWVGGSSQAALRRAVRLGDGWHENPLHPAELHRSVNDLQALAAAEGRDLGGFTISLRQHVRFADTRTTDAEWPKNIIGPPAYVVDRLAELRTGLRDHLVVHLHEGEPLPDVLRAMERFAATVPGQLAAC